MSIERKLNGFSSVMLPRLCNFLPCINPVQSVGVATRLGNIIDPNEFILPTGFAFGAVLAAHNSDQHPLSTIHKEYAVELLPASFTP